MGLSDDFNYVINTLFKFLLAIIFIVAGSILLIDEKTIKSLDASRKSTFNYVIAGICIVYGSVTILYYSLKPFFNK
jgi:coenzyme F420-reducing hydrogenase gamma subunit